MFDRAFSDTRGSLYSNEATSTGAGLVMRFLPDGPSLPDELLEERDNGNVVFLCGAGVSSPAGMPNFLGLTRYVVEELGAPEDAPSRTMLSRWDDESIPADARPPLDQIFNLLQQEYAAGEIDYLIAKRLKTRHGTDISAHETILRLSKSIDGKPQIITTNFDLLFEKASGRKKWPIHAPPALPDLASAQTLNGIVYLHGRVNSRIKRGEGRQGFVVSSSDFGRAYLAEGWATRFMRDFLDKYIVVLLGYAANDPPVRYLLQGLHTRRHGNHKPLFAFDRGPEEEVQQRWRDSGVRALAYFGTENDHSSLWNTLSAWADRADDPLAWRQRVIDLARRGPRNLAPYERGQVASLVRTDMGAKLFADANSPSPDEWLCVFDRNVRYGVVGRSFDGSEPDFDPLIEYGLDDDPPRPPATLTPTNPPGDDLLLLRSTDRSTNVSTRLAGISRQHVALLPSRLVHLAEWIVKVSHKPVVPWWAAKYAAFHPYLLDRIEWRVGQANDETIRPAQPVWRLLIEKFQLASDDDRDLHRLYKTLERIKIEGWTNGALRAFERSGAPYLQIKSPFGIDDSRPPDGDWAGIRRNQVARFEVAFPGVRYDPPEIPDDVLPAAYQVLRRHLELAARLLKDIGTVGWKTATFYPEDKPGENYLMDGEAYLFQFRNLFDRMVRTRPELLRADIVLWPLEEPFFFNKLHLYAWTSNRLFSGDEVGAGLRSLSDQAFWKEYDRRELLHLLLLRWGDLPSDKRELLERRLANGPAQYNGELEDDYDRRRSIESATVLGWLMNQGCELSDETQKALPSLRSADPRWRPERDEAADESYDGGGGIFQIDSDPSLIIDAHLSQIISLAKKYTQSVFDELTEYRPFDGLVEQRPSRAVAALTNAARQGDYPGEFWGSAMQHWPAEERSRLVWLFGARLARLPSEIVVELQHDVFQWLRNHLPKLAAWDQHRALGIFDVLLGKLFEGEVGEAEEGRGDTQTTATPPDRSRRSFEHALGSPIGLAAALFIDLLNSQNLERGSGLPPEIKLRLERLIAAPGEGSDYAVYTIAQQLERLDSIDPEWTRRTIVPWFNLEYSATEPAWNGFLFNNNRPPEPPLFSMLKSDFLKAFSHASEFNWNDSVSRHLHEFLLTWCSWHQDDPAYISFDEARRALQQTDDKGRAHTIWFLSIIARSKKWASFGKLFLEKAWPKELSFQTARTSRSFLWLLEEAGDLFPEVVQASLPYLVPISQGGPFVYGLTKPKGEEGSELPRRFPDATLALLDKLVPDNPDQIPYNLDVAVEMVAEAKPSLRQDQRWRRLNDLALHR